MEEATRSDLSEKKKIKDLFLVVIRSIDFKESMPIISQLISFASNLCYGTGKFRRMLATDKETNPEEFFGILKTIVEGVTEKTPADEASIAKAVKEMLQKEANTRSAEVVAADVLKKHKTQEQARVLLKQCVLALISNLCLDPTLRGWIANDMSGILSSVTVLFKNDLKEQAFDWLTSLTRSLNVLVNSAQEKPA